MGLIRRLVFTLACVPIGFLSNCFLASAFASPKLPPTTAESVKPSNDATLPLSSYADVAVVRETANEAQRDRISAIKAETVLDLKAREAFLNKGVEFDKFNITLFNKQLTYHPLILATVLTLVLSSTCLVIVQFWRWSKESSVTESTLEITKDGLKVKSPFIGLLMLLASYAFFYLYILEVYKIRTIGETDLRAAQAQIPSASATGVK